MLLRLLLLFLVFGWLLRIGLRLLRFVQGAKPPRPGDTPRPPHPGETKRPSDDEWDGESIEEADYEELP